MTFQTPSINWIALLPQLILVITALLVMMVDIFVRDRRKGQLSFIALAGSAIFGVISLCLWGANTSAFENMILLDSFSCFLNGIIALATVLTILVSVKYVEREGIPESEYYSLLLFSASGMSLLASAGNLLILFLAVEIMSISLYVLTSIVRDRLISNEAALKYFLLGAFASGFLLYGIALIFGATGSIDLVTIGNYLKANSLFHSPLVLIAVGLLLVGFAFKVALVPFHMWTPDVYQGAPSSVTGFMATGVKAAAFAAILRVFMHAFEPMHTDWGTIFWILAVLTMTLGNIIALVQDNIKRMLAYSSIAHAGYLAIGLVVGTKEAFAAMLFYLVAYTLMNIGAFAIVLLIERHGEKNLNIDDYRGLADKYPVLALTMAIFMFSLGGIPPAAGFIGKFYIFSEAVRAGLIGLALIGVLNSVLSVYYYLRVIVNMYMKPREDEVPNAHFDNDHTVALTISAIGTLILGIFPAALLASALGCFNNF